MHIFSPLMHMDEQAMFASSDMGSNTQYPEDKGFDACFSRYLEAEDAPREEPSVPGTSRQISTSEEDHRQEQEENFSLKPDEDTCTAPSPGDEQSGSSETSAGVHEESVAHAEDKALADAPEELGEEETGLEKKGPEDISSQELERIVGLLKELLARPDSISEAREGSLSAREAEHLLERLGLVQTMKGKGLMENKAESAGKIGTTRLSPEDLKFLAALKNMGAGEGMSLDEVLRGLPKEMQERLTALVNKLRENGRESLASRKRDKQRHTQDEEAFLSRTVGSQKEKEDGSRLKQANKPLHRAKEADRSQKTQHLAHENRINGRGDQRISFHFMQTGQPRENPETREHVEGWEKLRSVLNDKTVVESSAEKNQEKDAGLYGKIKAARMEESEEVEGLHASLKAEKASRRSKAQEGNLSEQGDGLAGKKQGKDAHASLLKDSGQGSLKDGGFMAHTGKESSHAASLEHAGSSDTMFSRSLLEGENAAREGLSRRVLSRQVLDQVQQGAFRNIGQGKKQLTLKLNPGHLGTVHVVLQVKGKDVNAVLRTSREEVSGMLGEQMAQLKDQLEKQGLRVNKLEVQNQLASDDRPSQWGGGFDHNQSRERMETGLRELRWRAMQREGEVLAQDMQTTDHTVNISHEGVDFFA